MYLAVFSISVVLGTWFAWVGRGSYDFFWGLLQITLGYGIPVLVILFIIWTAEQEHISPQLKFIAHIAKGMILFLMIQWFFFSLGKNILGEKDLHNARKLCESSNNWVFENKDALVFEEFRLEPVLPDGTKFYLGNIKPPEIIHWKKRVESEDGLSDVQSILMCRLIDPRFSSDSPKNKHSYNFNLKKWTFDRGPEIID